MDEISTSFCFICLLHLANEQGLKLEIGVKQEGEMPSFEQTLDEDVAASKRIGDLWGVKVYRDPNATASA